MILSDNSVSFDGICFLTKAAISFLSKSQTWKLVKRGSKSMLVYGREVIKYLLPGYFCTKESISFVVFDLIMEFNSSYPSKKKTKLSEPKSLSIIVFEKPIFWKWNISLNI